jgi:hypothetical protein
MDRRLILELILEMSFGDMDWIEVAQDNRMTEFQFSTRPFWCLKREVGISTIVLILF